MHEIVIGKHTLESLTTGMYSDPFVIYREYIQNAADSIDSAIKAGVLCKGDDCIDIHLHIAEKRITIRDNGVGISSADAAARLLSIGDSKKVAHRTRGFRGIGRLSGLSYCSKLTFETSMQSECIGTRVTIDSKRLAELLVDNIDSTSTIVDVLNEVYTVETYPEKEKLHYFSVIMDGVDDSVKLTDYTEVINYLSQNAPVPYNFEKFIWGKEVVNRLSQKGCNIEAYNVYVNYQNRREQVYKPYTDSFLADRNKNIIDRISDIQIVSYMNSENEILAAGWIATLDYFGSIFDRSIKGIRLRKGNILIGDNQTLNVIFKDARFNGWAVGEIFALHPKLIPNARRDNFEKNPHYFTFIEKLTVLANSITKDIRNASLKRNAELSAAIEATERVSEAATDAINNGMSASQKNVLKSELSNIQTAVGQVPLNGEVDAYCQEIAFEELDMLIGTIKGATSFKALNSMKNLSSSEKKTLERVLKLIMEYDAEAYSDLIDFILSGYSQGGENVV
ncbi:MAG: ATP-binding protein [Clostridia bacterium]|nr:ATP-binding protein [Clostridia bacterium]